MHIVEHARDLMLHTGAAWVLWLLVALSVLSIGVIVDRAIAFRILGDLKLVRQALRDSLREGGFPRARRVMAACPHPGARVILRGMDEPEDATCPSQAQDAMASESLAQRGACERHLGLLATLGANAPFIGLLGTVVGILQAFDSLGRAGPGGSSAPQAVMSSIAEALVATAVGLAVAIPAVFAYNVFQRRLALAFEQARMLELELLAYLHARAAHPGAEQ
jgi:biopolymer transport protein ExbB